MIKSHGSILWACLLLGCASSPQTRQDSQAPREQGVLVSLELTTPRRDRPGEREVQPGESLGSGDKLAMQIRVDRPSYVYLLHTTPSGDVSVLYPEQGEVKAQPGEVVRVPPSKEWFELSGKQGPESMVVVASTQPLTPQALQEAQQHPTPSLATPGTGEMFMAQDDKKQDDKKQDDKRDMGCSSKANDECKRGDPKRLSARAGQRGVAVIRFPFLHR